MVDVKKIQPCKDPVTKMLFGRFGYKVVYFWITCNAIFVLISLYYGTLTEIGPLHYGSSVNTDTVPLLKDVSFYVYLTLGICGIILIDQVLKEVPCTFINLWENKILRSKTRKQRLVSEYNRQLEEVEKKINSKKSYIFAIVYILISSVFVFVNIYRIPIEESPVIVYNDIRLFPLSGIAAHATYALLYFLLVTIAYKSILLVFFLRKLHKTFDFQVNPFHPDRCGGLKPLGDFCLAINYVIIIFFVAIVTSLSSPRSEELSLYFNLPLYIFFATFFLVYPLWPIHETMKEQKTEILIMLEEKLGPAYFKSLDELIEKSTDLDVEKMDTRKAGRIDRIYKRKRGSINTIYEQTDGMRIWPFKVSSLIWFLTVFALISSVIAIVAVFA